MTENHVVEQVRDRYVAAARAAMGAGRRPLDLLNDVDAGSCCAEDSCCSGTIASEADVFGSALYADDPAGEVPAEAVRASLGCGNPTAVADLNPGSGCSIWAPAVAWMCCCLRAGWARRGSPTAST